MVARVSHQVSRLGILTKGFEDKEFYERDVIICHHSAVTHVRPGIEFE